MIGMPCEYFQRTILQKRLIEDRLVKSGTDFRDLSDLELTLVDSPEGSVRKKTIKNVRGTWQRFHMSILLISMRQVEDIRQSQTGPLPQNSTKYSPQSSATYVLR